MLNQKGEDSREQIGFYCMEDLVPQDHLLRKIEKAINFSFIYDLVKDKYSEDAGRPSIDPVVLFKIVFIQYLFGIRSMRQTIKDIEV
ncbi:MAG: transposase, partial [Oscillospiraceae bacterium]|nr:transposase [Oscillospiraceae bacterium]MCI1990864.1 transposase [Oscillospiraceae bacterium]